MQKCVPCTAVLRPIREVVEGRRKTEGSWNRKRYSRAKYRQEEEPSSFVKGRTVVQLVPCCRGKQAEVEKVSVMTLKHHSVTCFKSCPSSGGGRKWGCGVRSLHLGIAGKA